MKRANQKPTRQRVKIYFVKPQRSHETPFLRLLGKSIHCSEKGPRKFNFNQDDIHIP